MRSKVDLPQPDGPDDADKFARRDLEADVVDRDDGRLRAAELLAQVIDLDGGPAPLDCHASRISIATSSRTSGRAQSLYAGHRHPGNLLSLFSSTNGPSLPTA